MDQLQWLEWRKKGVGASDAPSIMGVSPFKTLNQLLKEKLMGETQTENAAMRRGNELEPLALDYFMAETGHLLESQKCYQHKEHEWMRATVDGINEEERILLEIKSCRELHEEVPIYYYPQLQHQMEVLGYDRMYYISYDGTLGKILEVEKNPEYIKVLIQKEMEFWEIVKKGCQDMSEHEEWLALTEKLKDLRLCKKELDEEEEFLISQLILFADGVNSKGNGVSLLKKTRKGSVDYKKIPQLQGIDTSLYRKPDVQYWSADIAESIA